MLTFDEIMANRRKWIDFLLLPDTKKAKGRLVDVYDSNARCCLGHACHVLGLRDVVTESITIAVGYVYASATGRTAVSESVLLGSANFELLGMWSPGGDAGDTFSNRRHLQWEDHEQRNLAGFNDQTEMTPQDIGRYLQSVIHGGLDTPFMDKEQYEKEIKSVELQA